MTAHQRLIREDNAITHPRANTPSLDGFSVETISRQDAAQVILRYEWLGTMGRTVHHVGLLSPARELHGVACFGYGPAGKIRSLIGEPALCLERGACVHYAPPNAASFLINNACKLLCRIYSVPLFFAYADPKAGEYGGVYQAAGWIYLGQGLSGLKKDHDGKVTKDRVVRKLRYEILAPGLDPSNDTNWRTTRDLRRGDLRQGDRGMTFKEAKQAGWEIRLRAGKHVYAINVGRDRRKWRRTMVSLPYPAPEPERKLKSFLPTEPFRLSKPVPSQSDFFAGC